MDGVPSGSLAATLRPTNKGAAGNWRRIILAGFVLILASQASASLILAPAGGLDDLFAGPATPVGGVRTADIAAPTFTAQIYSQVYTDGELYVYLYQIHNLLLSPDPIELFTISPFLGADPATTQLGYLTAAAPDGFSTSGPTQLSEDTGNIRTVSGPIVSFYFSDRYGCSIDPGEWSAVLYVTSYLPPGEAWGNLIDGSVGTDLVVAPVPEPATMGALALGGLGLVGAAARNRRKSRG